MNFDDHLNATGALCPIPVLKAQKRLKKIKKWGYSKYISR